MSSSHDHRRDRADRLATLAARLGGISVIVLLALMFLFLLREALPLLGSAEWARPATPAAAYEAGAPAAPGTAGENPHWPLRAVHAGYALELRADDGSALARVPMGAPEAMAWSAGGGALIVAADGRLRRLVLHRDDDGRWQWTPAGEHQAPAAPVTTLLARPDGAGFVALAGRELLAYRTGEHRPVAVAGLDSAPAAARFAEDGVTLLLAGGAGTGALRLADPYPRATLAALWTRSHLEYRQMPEAVWQATSSGALTAPKYNLLPLVWGTLKAALLGILFGAPVAVLAAIHVAFFARRSLRRWVKPALELMEGLPTVMLGLVALIFLAPEIEAHLLAFVVLVLSLPLIALISGWLAGHLHARLGGSSAARLPLLTLPLLLLGVVAALGFGMALEARFESGFAGYLEQELGWTYATRNGLVVGLVVGLAIIPSIFTLAEDAVFGVPGHLPRGAFALGATRWQAFRTVVLPLASPGILAALIIGFARAVGETMIVLMVSGNTPELSASPLTGLRSLSANLAIELPESAPGSEHYRVLFLSALLLFAATFLFNALAEWVRTRLRRRYRLAT